MGESARERKWRRCFLAQNRPRYTWQVSWALRISSVLKEGRHLATRLWGGTELANADMTVTQQRSAMIWKRHEKVCIEKHDEYEEVGLYR